MLAILFVFPTFSLNLSKHLYVVTFLINWSWPNRPSVFVPIATPQTVRRGGKRQMWTEIQTRLIEVLSFCWVCTTSQVIRVPWRPILNYETPGCCRADHLAARLLHLLPPASRLASHSQLQWGGGTYSHHQLKRSNLMLSISTALRRTHPQLQ